MGPPLEDVDILPSSDLIHTARGLIESGDCAACLQLRLCVPPLIWYAFHVHAHVIREKMPLHGQLSQCTFALLYR